MDELRFCRECKRQVVRPVYFKSLIFCSKRCRTANRPQKQPPDPGDPIDGLFAKAKPTPEQELIWSEYILDAARRIRKAAEASWSAKTVPDTPEAEKAYRANLDALRRSRRRVVDDEDDSDEDDWDHTS